MRNLHLTLTVGPVVKSKMKISQKFVAFSEFMNFKGEKKTVFGHFLAKLALVLLLELAETCSTLKMEMSRS